jgi:hypothetical protein
MWVPFRMHNRDMEWAVEPGLHRRLLVRSRDGHFRTQSLILDDVWAGHKGVTDSMVCAPLILGDEFPLGCPIPAGKIELHEGFEVARYGIIHTEFVRSLVERWAHRRRYRRRLIASA